MTPRANVVLVPIAMVVIGLAGIAPLRAVGGDAPPAPMSAPLPPPPGLVDQPVACAVTRPDDSWPSPPGIVPDPNGTKGGGFGNGALWTNLWMWSDGGQIPVPLSHVLPDGSFGPMKWAWFRYSPGRLGITGRRVDAPAPPLRAWIPDGYGETGLQVSTLSFPTGGCWEVTGRVGKASLTFVIRVVPPATVDRSGVTSAVTGDRERYVAAHGRAGT